MVDAASPTLETELVRIHHVVDVYRGLLADPIAISPAELCLLDAYRSQYPAIKIEYPIRAEFRSAILNFAVALTNICDVYICIITWHHYEMFYKRMLDNVLGPSRRDKIIVDRRLMHNHRYHLLLVDRDAWSPQQDLPISEKTIMYMSRRYD